MKTEPAAPELAALELVTLVLAAGSGSRFEGIKQLAEVAGQALILRACALAETIAPGAVHVILGTHHEAIAERLPSTVRVIEHPSWADGMGSSLAAGITALDAHCDAALVLLADQVALRHQALSEMIARWRADPDTAVCAHYGGQPGVPAIFPRRLFAELAGLRGDRGAKPTLLRETGPDTQLAMPEAAIDIDTPADLVAWQATIR